jgi:hypothetical protein
MLNADGSCVVSISAAASRMRPLLRVRRTGACVDLERDTARVMPVSGGSPRPASSRDEQYTRVSTA